MTTAPVMSVTDEQPAAKFRFGDLVRKTKGSQWHGRVVGTYSTELTPDGYAVESATERGSVQIYPAAALEAWQPVAEQPDTVMAPRELLDSAATWLEVHAPAGGCVERDVADELRALLARGEA